MSTPTMPADDLTQLAHRAALDHVLALITDSPFGDSLVLRGSMAMLAWVGDRSRAPRDIDWVVRRSLVVPLDDRHPYPFLNHLDRVQTWPEAAHGAGRNQLWTFEDFDTGGFKPRLPPEGLRWIAAEETAQVSRPHRDVVDLVRERPHASGGVFIDAEAATEDADFAYAYDPDPDAADDGQSAGARILLPWRVMDGPSGVVQVDFAYDEALPEPPHLLAVPRADGGPPTVVWAATAPLSLTWKLRWLADDQQRRGHSQGKDLVDAVLLAELDGIELSARLRQYLRVRLANPDALRPDAIRRWVIDWGNLDRQTVGQRGQDWLDRLATALTTLALRP